MSGVAVTVAKKRSKPGPKPSVEGPRDALVALKCRLAWKEWLVEYAKSARVTPAQIIDISVAEKAARDGFKKPPER